MKRITVEMVKEAYAKTGLRPVQNSELNFQKFDDYADPIVALYAAETGQKVLNLAYEKAKSDYHHLYILGFENGVDGNKLPIISWQSQLGYQDGRTCWEAVKP